MESDLSVMEKGDIYFFFYPKVVSPDEKVKVESIDDTQHIFMILRNEHTGQFRKIMMGKKRLPRAAEPLFCFVEKVTKVSGQMEKTLEENKYATKTRGVRERPRARLLAEGKYLIASHQRNTHLIYQLEEPPRLNRPREDVELEREGNFLLTVKNPQKHSENEPISSHKIALPSRLQDLFKDRRFLPLDPPDFLDYEGIELLLVGEKSKPDDKWEHDITQAFKSFPHEEVSRAFGIEERKRA